MFKLTSKTGAAAAALLATTATPAHAYMGAGAGLSAIGSMISFIGVFLLMLFGFVWFPLKRAIKKMAGKGDETTESVSAKEEASETEEVA